MERSVETAGLSCGFRDWSVWNLTGFRTGGNLSHGTGTTTDLPSLRVFLDHSATS
jgi:hypothetical protein